jgi:hypothetical protein
MTRSEHLQWCKDRALAYLDRGEIADAVTSMLSDMSKHEETALPADSPLTMFGLMAVMGSNIGDARRFIEGFN